MISQDQFFELISLVSSESKKADPLFEQSMELLSKIELNFSQLINEQAFQGRSELKHQLNKAIAEAQLQVSLPMLSNRHNLVVVSKEAKTNLEILQSVSKYMFMPPEFEQAFKRIALLKLPVIFYHGSPQEPATVYNLVDNVVSLEMDKLCAFLNLSSRDIPDHEDAKAPEGQAGQNSSEIALARPMDLAQLCAVPWEFKDEFKHLNLIFMSELSQDSNHLRLLSMSQSALVIPNDGDVPCDFGDYPLDVKVYADNAQQALAINYVEACKSLAMSKGQGLMQIDTITADKLVSFLMSKSQSSTNINLSAQLQAISYNLSLNLKQSDAEVKGRIEGLNRFLLESHISEPFVQEMLSKAREQQQSINQQLVQSNEFNHVVFETVSELIELFNQRGFDLQSQDTLVAGGVLAWRQLFELGSMAQDIPLMRRSIQARIDCDERVKTVQKLYVDFLEGQVNIKGVIDQYLKDQSSLSYDAYRHTLIMLCMVTHDEIGLNSLAKYVAQSLPLERRNAQENLLVGKYLTAKNNNTVNQQAQEAFEVALSQGETSAIDYLVTPYLKEAQVTNNDSKLRSLALTYHPKAAFEYASYLKTCNNPEFENFMLMAASQSYEPALKFYADYCYEKVATEHPVKVLRVLSMPSQQMDLTNCRIGLNKLINGVSESQYIDQLTISVTNVINRVHYFDRIDYKDLVPNADASIIKTNNSKGPFSFLGDFRQARFPSFASSKKDLIYPGFNKGGRLKPSLGHAMYDAISFFNNRHREPNPELKEQEIIFSLLDSIFALGHYDDNKYSSYFVPLENKPLPTRLDLCSQQALSIYQKLGEQSDKNAAQQGFLLYVLGKKVESIPFLTKAANYGDYFAKMALGSMYLFGEAGIAPDSHKAMSYVKNLRTPEGLELLIHVAIVQTIEETRKRYGYNQNNSYQRYTY